MKHLPDGGDVAPQEDGDRLVAVGGHVVEEPPAGGALLSSCLVSSSTHWTMLSFSLAWMKVSKKKEVASLEIVQLLF